jgi:hypothetical protein
MDLRIRVAALAAGLAAAGAAAAQPTVAVVMSGLDNPRGLAFAPNGALYVTEAGRGGPPAPDGSNCGFNGAMEFRCYGASGGVTRLFKGVQERVASGLPSHANPDGTSAGGANDIAFQGTGNAFVTLGLGGGPALLQALGSDDLGTLVQMAASGRWRVVADIALYESEENPGGGPLDSNPYGVLAEPGGRLVVDAGGNALLRVAANGTIETLAVFPSRPGRPTDSVPTTVARGPDGALYVGEHAGGPVFFPLPGRLLRVAPDGTRSTVLDGLDRPTSVALGDDGALYVTNHTITPGAGEVLRIAQ